MNALPEASHVLQPSDAASGVRWLCGDGSGNKARTTSSQLPFNWRFGFGWLPQLLSGTFFAFFGGGGVCVWLPH